MTFLDLFSGVGGFTRGLELAGHKCVGHCEFDKFAEASYRAMHTVTEAQRKYLLTLPLRRRQKEILEEEYLNGEWYARDIRAVRAESMPNADCWTFGAPCQDFSFAGKRAGLDGDRSSLVRQVFNLLGKRREEDRPEWLIYENVKGMLSTNGGFDYLEIITKMDELGYDVEWQNINSKWFVPQNRERIYTIGHLRARGRQQILPVEGTDGEAGIRLIGHRKIYRKNSQIFSSLGISGTLDTAQGGGRVGCVPVFCDLSRGGFKITGSARCLQARYSKGVSNRFGECSEVAIAVKDAEPGSEQSPVAVIWSERHQCHLAIRRFTPKECFRLQGWTDEYFERARAFNSDTQLYRQAGNGVTVPVVEAIGRKIKKFVEEKTSEDT